MQKAVPVGAHDLQAPPPRQVGDPAALAERLVLLLDKTIAKGHGEAFRLGYRRYLGSETAMQAGER